MLNMAGLTIPQEIPYPEYNDAVDVHTDMQAMAQKVNDLITDLQVPFLPLNVKNNSGGQLTAGTPVYINGFNVVPTVAKSIASDINTFPAIGLIKETCANTEPGIVIISGTLEGVNTNSFSNGDLLYVGTSGGLTNTQPASGSSVVGVVGKSAILDGVIIVGVVKGGNGTWGSVKNGL